MDRYIYNSVSIRKRYSDSERMRGERGEVERREGRLEKKCRGVTYLIKRRGWEKRDTVRNREREGKEENEKRE